MLNVCGVRMQAHTRVHVCVTHPDLLLLSGQKLWLIFAGGIKGETPCTSWNVSTLSTRVEKVKHNDNSNHYNYDNNNNAFIDSTVGNFAKMNPDGLPAGDVTDRGGSLGPSGRFSREGQLMEDGLRAESGGARREMAGRLQTGNCVVSHLLVVGRRRWR